MGHLLPLCMLLFLSYPVSLARYTTEPEYGSGEDVTVFSSNTQSYDIVGSTTENSMKNENGTTTSVNVLESIKQFFKDYLLLVIVVGSLVALLIFIMCAAVIMSHRHKASAYYPSSFPPKEYVNHDDKNGGTRAFNEIPDKPHDAKVDEVVSSGNQLQTDILNAAQNLKSPSKGGSIKEQKHCEEPQKICEQSQKETPQEPPSDNCPESFQTQVDSSNPENKVKEVPTESPGQAKPEGDSQEPPVEPVEQTKPTVDCQEVLPDPGQETQPASESQEAPAESKPDVPSPPAEVSAKEEINPTPSECETANNNPCESKESQQAPDTESCRV